MEGNTNFSNNYAHSGGEPYHEVTTDAGTFGENHSKNFISGDDVHHQEHDPECDRGYFKLQIGSTKYLG